MPTSFQKFVNKELPKRINTEQDPTALEEGRIPVSTGIGLQTEFKRPSEVFSESIFEATIDPNETVQLFQFNLDNFQVFDCIIKTYQNNKIKAQKLFGGLHTGEMDVGEYSVVGQNFNVDINFIVQDNYCIMEITNNEAESINIKILVQPL